MKDWISIHGAREHNLKNINLDIPRNKLVVFTGLSGSGKSSLAFDTIYAEGQRRYVESLSAYARQFLEQTQKPDVDYIEGLSPAISIDQKALSRNPRSTVGTITEIYDYLRLLYATVGAPHCPKCGRPITKLTVDQITDQILGLPNGFRIQILAPIVRSRKGEFKELLEQAHRDGFVRVRIDGKTTELPYEERLNKKMKHDIEIVIDRLEVTPSARRRITESVETALRQGEGTVMADLLKEREGSRKLTTEKGNGRSRHLPFSLPAIFSEKFGCAHCGGSIEEISPRIFSFNSPYGACPECKGLGNKLEFDPDLIIPDKNLSVSEGAIVPWNSAASYYMTKLDAVAEHFGFSLTTPVKKLLPKQLQLVLYGSGEERIQFKYLMERSYWEHEGVFEGVVNNLRRRYLETKSEHVRLALHRYMSAFHCEKCKGTRLKPESLAIKIGGKSIAEMTALSVRNVIQVIENLVFTDREKQITKQVTKELRSRLKFLLDVGLDYLSLNREATTLSGGEAQRTRLATQIGSGLTGVLYVLDEPSIGLHPKDNQRLLQTLTELRNLGNTIIVVEHDNETIRAADFVVDIGPGAGRHGGEIVASGSVEDIESNPRSVTGAYLSGKASIPVPEKRRYRNEKHLTVHGATHNNLQKITARFPLGLFVAVTGVSGSGKSSLVNDILFRALSKHFYRALDKPGDHESITGMEHIDKVIIIDQSPIGRTPRSNPATYTGVFQEIRDIFAHTEAARARGYQPGRFSFNVKGGRCEACQGDGVVKIEMHFLPDVYVPCEVCKGKRYNKETLEVRYHGKNISEILTMTVEEAAEIFQHVPPIERKLRTLVEVGLSYVQLGQSATTLSGGEAQRVKLATELSARSTGRTLYLLDEPTTGLHADDIRKLLSVLQQLCDAGNTVIVIEHNLEVIKVADHIIDLGPGGGEQGGKIVAEGTPEEVAENPESFTGKFLRPLLKRAPAGHLAAK